VVLVAGATGTVGSSVVAQLHERGVPVRAGSRDPHSATTALPAGVPRVRLDVTDTATWPAALDGVDRVFLLRPPQIARSAAMTGFVDAVARAGVGRVAFLSVQGAGANPLLPHRGIERLLESSALDWTFLRAGWFHQNLLTAHHDDVVRGELAVPAGGGRTALVDARDVAAAAVAALTERGHARRAYELTAEAPTWTEIADTLACATGRPVRYTQPGVPRYVLTELSRHQPPALVLVTTALYTATRLGLAARTTGDLAALLDRVPTTLSQFAAEHAERWT
jgi:uncharacterized protein YbjT (DUF2867 family)